MRFNLLVCAAPEDVASTQAFAFAKALLETKHQLNQIYFYAAGVCHAERSHPLYVKWCNLYQDNHIPLLLCETAIEKYAIDVHTPFKLAGLGQFFNVLLKNERCMVFKS